MVGLGGVKKKDEWGGGVGGVKNNWMVWAGEGWGGAGGKKK